MAGERVGGAGPGGETGGAGAVRSPGRVIPYPTDHLLAVFDDPQAAVRSISALPAAGFADDDVVVLSPTDRESGFDALAARHPRWTRLLRIVQFTTMDQMPDLVLYEASLEAGRTVVAVHVRERPAMLAARSILAGAGGHFINYFGRTSTEEFDRWRGPELDLPEVMRH